MATCQYCDKVFADQNKVAEHDKTCPENPFSKDYMPNIIKALVKIRERMQRNSDKDELENIIHKLAFYSVAPLAKELNMNFKAFRDIIKQAKFEPIEKDIKPQPLTPQPLILMHKLIRSDVIYNYFAAEIRDFLRKHGLIPQKTLAKDFEFTIYDNMGNPYHAKLDYKQDRLFSKEWYKHFKPNIGDDIIVKIEQNLILIYPEYKW